MAFLSISSFFLIELQLGSYLAALINSSAKASAILRVFLKAFSLAYLVIKYIDWLILLNEETSTACLLTLPPFPILVESSLAPQTLIASITTYKGFSPVYNSIISRHCFMIRIALSFLPVFLPWNITPPQIRSIRGMVDFLNWVV